MSLNNEALRKPEPAMTPAEGVKDWNATPAFAAAPAPAWLDHPAPAMGIIRDEKGRILASHTPDGAWSEHAYDAHGNELAYRSSNAAWYEYTYDDYGNVLTFRNSAGLWFEFTRDENGRDIAYRDSEGIARRFVKDPDVAPPWAVLSLRH